MLIPLVPKAASWTVIPLRYPVTSAVFIGTIGFTKVERLKEVLIIPGMIKSLVPTGSFQETVEEKVKIPPETAK